MFWASIAPIIRSTKNCNCSLWYRSLLFEFCSKNWNSSVSGVLGCRMNDRGLIPGRSRNSLCAVLFGQDQRLTSILSIKFQGKSCWNIKHMSQLLLPPQFSVCRPLQMCCSYHCIETQVILSYFYWMYLFLYLATKFAS